MNQPRSCGKLLSALALMAACTAAQAQVNAPPYGPPLTLDQAKKMMAGAGALAKKNNWSPAETTRASSRYRA